jgi:hypothetical protein
MNIAENFEKLRCAQLLEQKEVLTKQLKFLYEQPSMGAQSIGQQTQQQYGQPNIRAKKPIKKVGKGQAESEDTPEQAQQPGQFDMAQPHQGFALTPRSAAAQKEILTTYFDRPETAEVEEPTEATWQNLQQAISHYQGSEVNKLMRQQRMLG